MSDYTELVKALLSASTVSTAWEKLMRDAAAAIEELQQIADHYEQTAKDYWKEACEYKAQLPKRGEIVRRRECRWGHLCVTGQHLGLDGFCSKGEREVQE